MKTIKYITIITISLIIGYLGSACMPESKAQDTLPGFSVIAGVDSMKLYRAYDGLNTCYIVKYAPENASVSCFKN